MLDRYVLGDVYLVGILQHEALVNEQATMISLQVRCASLFFEVLFRARACVGAVYIASSRS